MARILCSVPTHEEQPLSARQIVARAAEGFDGLALDDVELTTTTVLVLLRTFGALSEQAGLYRCRGEVPVYFTRSFAWFVARGIPLLDNWLRHGVGDDISINALLDAAPYLLKLMENKRLRTAGAEPVRDRPVACVLVKTVVDGRAHYLFEWDRVAAQFQIIGGYIDAGENPMSAAAQELIEEVVIEPGHRLEQGRHFDIKELDWKRPLPLEWSGVSRTVGALTRYRMWVYGVQLKMSRLTVRGDCQWLSTDEILAGRTRFGRRTDNPVFYDLIDASLAGGLSAVPVSIGRDAVPQLDGSADSLTEGRPTVFVGHGRSAAWRDLAEHLRDRHRYRVTTFDAERHAGQSMTEILARLVEQAQFAILVHTAEDEQAGGGLRARQNVVHETGLFQGRLGFSRAIIVRQRGCDAFSNVAGMQEVHYSTDIKEVFGDVLAALRREIG